MKKIYGKLLSFVLVLVMVLAMAGCGATNEVLESQVSVETQEVASAETEVETAEVTVLGEGAKTFAFTVVDKDGNEANFEIHTDKETVGEALLDAKLIEGEEGAYGLYVKKVNGIVADYDVNQTYWAFYIDGEYAMSGVDVTKIEEGKTYTFKVEK